jgi:hypothetical protein
MIALVFVGFVSLNEPNLSLPHYAWTFAGVTFATLLAAGGI